LAERAAFTDPFAIDKDDLAEPSRLLTVAMSPVGRILLVVTIQPGERTRLISARRATSHERREYEKGL
jgi:uncharacterized protein